MKTTLLLAILSVSPLLACLDKVVLPLYCKTEGCIVYAMSPKLVSTQLVWEINGVHSRSFVFVDAEIPRVEILDRWCNGKSGIYRMCRYASGPGFAEHVYEKFKRPVQRLKPGEKSAKFWSCGK